MLDLRRAADVTMAGSLANRMRNRRFRVFETLVDTIQRPLHILDIGGTESFWEQRGWADSDDVKITVLNLHGGPSRFKNIDLVAGDATNLSQYADREFDVAFSNSVIEHLFTFEKQKKMASEVRRVANAYWIQTPNYWFPIEPHFHVLGWQYLPRKLRVFIIMRRRCGWRGPYNKITEAYRAVEEVRLMTRAELRELFPGATIWDERLFGLVKSIVAYDGFSESAISG